YCLELLCHMPISKFKNEFSLSFVFVVMYLLSANFNHNYTGFPLL
uniref:Uncharacterized protein n=1 Tax=Lates calcarifer TaxID=8187 RepID=A0A4W6CDV5_LATCA